MELFSEEKLPPAGAADGEGEEGEGLEVFVDGVLHEGEELAEIFGHPDPLGIPPASQSGEPLLQFVL